MSRGSRGDSSDDDDLRINTLHRFAKHSPRLTLQEYSHCEVPAGCGGVVLRWVDARSGVPIRVRVIVEGEAETWLDGAPLPGGHARIEAGEHVLALHVTKLGTETWAAKARDAVLPAPLVVDVLADHGPNRSTLEAHLLERARFGERRWTSTAPSVDFPAPAFDDGTWQKLEPAAPSVLEGCADHARRAYERLRQDGSTLFALGTRDLAPPAEAWVRIRFTLEQGSGDEQGRRRGGRS